jgi:Large polyvalent protein associated domain 22
MTDYLKLAQESAAPVAPDAAANPYLSLVEEDRKTREAYTRTVLETALRDKPDVAAERQRLAVTSGLPLRVVERNLDDVRVKEQARTIDLLRMAQDSPILARQLVDPTFTTLAVDDLPTLSKIEKAVGNATRYVMGAGPSNPVTDVGNAATDLALGYTVGFGKFIFDVAGAFNDALGLDRLAASARGAAKRAGESMEAYGSTPESSTGSAVKSGLQSTGTNLALLPVGLARGLYATANQAATTVAALMGAAVGAGAYNEARDAGKGKLESAAFGIPQGVFEFVFEKIPAQRLFGDLAANAGLMKTLRSQAISEGWTEQITTLAQDFNEWMNMHPEKTLGDFINERPEAAYQTFIATLVGVGVQTSTIHGINKVVEKATDQRLQFQQDAFEELQKMAAASALRQRSPEQFRALVKQVVDTSDTAQKSIHVDAQVLNQLGPDVLAQLPEAVRAQIQAEATKNGTVEISMADVLTVAPGTPLEQILNDHARMTPEAMSRADAQAAGDQAQVLRQEAEKVIQQAKDQEKAQADYTQVQQLYAQQIAESGRYRPAVAEQMGHWLASFYTAYGARTGMTATEMQARYPVRVLGAAPAGAQGGVMEQAEREAAEAAGFDSSTLWLHGTAATANFKGFKVGKKGVNELGPGIYFTKASVYADAWSGGGRVAGGRTIPAFIKKGDLFDLSQKADHRALARRLKEHNPVTDAEVQAKNIRSSKSATEWTTEEAKVIADTSADLWRLWLLESDEDLATHIEKSGSLNTWLSRAGYVGAFNPNSQVPDQVVVFDPKDIRSPWAKFNPKKADSNDLLAQAVYHGSPHTFEAFTLDAINTGEGAQVYGWGLYFAENREVAKGYYRRLRKGRDGEDLASRPRAVEKGQGGVYSVGIPNDDIPKMLLWDEPLAKQPAAVRAALTALGVPLKVFNVIDTSGNIVTSQESREKARLYIRKENVAGKVAETDADLTGERAYRLLRRKLGSDKAASEALDTAGVPGLRYLDSGSRANTDGTRNVVVWNQKTLDAMNAQVQRALEQRTTESVPRGTFNPATLDLVLNPNANLSTFFHETGHFFLEVMADIASQPNAPAQIVEDMGAFLKWAGVADDGTAGGADVGGSFSQAMQEQPLDDETQRAVLAVFEQNGGIGDINESTNIVAKSKAFAELAKREGFNVSDIGSKYIRIFKAIGKTADGYDKEIALRVRVSDHSNVNRGKHLGDVEINLAPDDGFARDTFESALWKMRTADVTENLDVTIAGRPADDFAFYQGGRLGSGTLPVQRKRTPLETWSAMTLDQKRAAHERWAEGIEQYVMEGRAPSVELQPLMRRFATWLKSVYGSIKQFLASKGSTTTGPVLGQSGDVIRLYHGGSIAVRQFDKGKARTATHIYLTDEERTARKYGSKLMRVDARPNKMLRLHPEDIGPKETRALRKVFNDIGADYGYDDFDAFVEAVTGATGAMYGTNSRFQDAFMNELFAAGYDAVAFPDPAPGGGWSMSYVFDDPLLLTVREDEGFDQGGGDTGAPMQLNDDIRRVMDRMLATDAQIAEANEVAGLLPDLEADALANERLNKRSMADLKWAVRARDQVIAKLRKQAKAIEKTIRAEVTAEVNASREVQAKDMLAKTQGENGGALNDTERAIIADAFSYESVEAMLLAIDAFGSKADVIDGMTQQRMLQEHGDLTDDAAIREAANEAVHNEARARSLATELRTQREMLNPRQDTGEVNAKGSKITVNALVEAAKQFAANVVARTPLRDLKSKAWQHTAAERRAGQRWQEATAGGKTQEAVQAKQDQMLNHAAAKAAIDAKTEMGKILEFFKRVTKGNDETVVEKGRDADIVNAARAVLRAYGIETPTTKTAEAYLEVLQRNDPETHGAIAPMVRGALQNAQPIEALTFEELQTLHDEIRAMWFLAKRSRQMEVGGDLLDRDDLAQELRARMEEIGIPDRVPGEGRAVSKAEERALFLRQGVSFLRRVEQWAEGFDGKYGGPFLRYVFQPVKDAANRYRTDRTTYRKKLQALVDNLAPIVGDQVIKAPDLGYEFGTPGSVKGTAMNEVLHAIAHTGNESNKRKLLLGRNWATENPDGTLDTSKWDTFIAHLVSEGKLERAHFDFVQGLWDLLEETKPLAQKAHRDAFGRYFAEVTADPFVDPFGVTRRGGYVPAIVDAEQVKDNELRKLAEAENESMAFAFPAPNKGFTKSRVDPYSRPLLLDLRTLSQHLDKVLLFSHMTVPARDVRKLITHKSVGQALTRIDPSVTSGMLQPWLQRSAQQVVETPIVGAGKWARVPSIIRARAGAALMFANVSNAVQQVTGLSTALIKVGPGHLMRAMAQHVAHPVKAAKAVWEASSYMDGRAKNEVAVMNEQMQAILLNPSVYEKAQAWSMRNAYFLQTAVDNALSPIVWTGAYNQAMSEGMTHDDAVRFADGTVRQTQGSTLPEDVSRLETGPAYARVFTQFIGYFNMVANTNATALQQIAGEVGLKKGAGRALGVVMVGLLVPLWAAEAIAQAFKGGPDDPDKDGYLDDWLAAVFGFGTIKGLLAMIPIAGQAANSAVNKLNNNPMDDRISLSPGLNLLESALGGNVQTVHEILSDSKDVNARRAVRDVATLVSIFTGLPAYAVARPVGYLAGVADNKIQPTGGVDAARGLVTGTASPESKVK